MAFPSDRHARPPGRQGIGGLLVLTLIILLVLLVMAIGHSKFSSQVLWTSQVSTEGSLAMTLAENAIEETRFELGRRVNDPADPLFDFFRPATPPGGARDVEGLLVNDPAKSHILSLLRGETYKHFNFDGDPVDVQILSQEPFGQFSFETRGLLRYSSSVVGYPVLRPKDKLVRQVEVRQEFKVSLIGPPSPFDRMQVYIHNGHEFLGLDSTDEWVNTNKLIQKMKEELKKLEKARDENREKLKKYESNKDECCPGYDQVMADLDAISFDGVRQLEKYEQAYSRQMLFPDPPLVLVGLNTTSEMLKPHEFSAETWSRLESEWRGLKAKADKAEQELRRLESDENWDGGAIRQAIYDLRRLSDWDQFLLMNRIYPIYFRSCRLDNAPRLIYNVIGADQVAGGGGSALAHYQSLLGSFAKDRRSWRQKFFYRIQKGSAASINEALDRFRQQQDPERRVLNGVVYVDNPDSMLVLTEAIPGKLVLIVEGDVRLANLPRADDRSILTVICYGTMFVDGEVHAALIPRGAYRPGTGPAMPKIFGSLILDESYHWADRQPRLTCELYPEMALTSSAETSPGKVQIFKDRQMVVMSPTSEARVVNRKGE
jgi:hypothetical protein